MNSSGSLALKREPPQAEMGLRLFDLFLRFNRRLQGLLNFYHSPLSTNESHLLFEVVPQNGVVARDIVGRLYLDKSSVSRVITALEKRNLLKCVPSERDKREKIVRITPKGTKILHEDLSLRAKEVHGCVYRLKSSELTKFIGYLERLADSLSSPPINPILDTAPLLVQIRRLTRSMGFIGGSVLDTGFPIDELQVLWLAQSSGVALSDLGFSLPYSPSDLSRLLRRLERKKLIRRKIDRGDKRRVEVLLTATGVEAVEHAKTAGSAKFKQLLRQWSHLETTEFICLLDRALVCPLPHELLTQRIEWKIARVENPDQFQEVRGFLMKELVRLNLHASAPAALIEPSNITYTLSDRQGLRAVLELAINGDDRSSRIVNFVSSLGLPSRVVLLELLSSAVREFEELETLSVPPYVRAICGRSQEQPKGETLLLRKHELVAELAQ